MLECVAARPDAYCYERFAYASPGLNGKGDAWLLDCPVYSEVCSSGDGVTFDRQRRFLQNSRGDVVGVQEGNPYQPDLELRYSVYGVPEIIPHPDPYHTADFNGDGDVGNDADITAFWACLANNCCSTCGSVDVNRDGDVGTDADIGAFYDFINGNISAPPPSTRELRFGFRGYWWDDHLKVYHVRHRVYDPASFRWLQPDPAGFIDGLNLYTYCGGDAINGIDPDGLDDHLLGKVWRRVGLPAVGEWSDDFDDGFEELVDYWSSNPSLNDVARDARDPEARKEVHDALDKAKKTAMAAGPAGALAASAVNIVDKGMTLIEVTVYPNDQPPTLSPIGPGVPVNPAQAKAAEDLAMALADGVKGAQAPNQRDVTVEPEQPGDRLPQDQNVNPKPPDPLRTDRPIGPSPTQNEQMQRDLAEAQANGATDPRVNQQQVNADNQRVGTNRPDLQYTDAQGRRVYTEYDSDTSCRGPGHVKRITANDPNGIVVPKRVN